jgi:hypothetical protein
MANVTKKQLAQELQFGSGAPYGNYTGLHYTFETNSSGVYVNSDQTTAVVQTNVVRIGILPAGMRIDDFLCIISDAFTGSATANIGFAYTDGVDSSAVPQDADYFDAALALDGTTRTRGLNLAVRPVKLPKDAYLILTIAGADLAAVGVMDIIVYGVLNAAP